MSDNENTPLENEAAGVETVDFEFFDRTWTVPATVRLSHQRLLRRASVYPNVDIVDAFLDEEQNKALDEINPTDDELDKFTDAIAAAIGHKSAGNS